MTEHWIQPLPTLSNVTEEWKAEVLAKANAYSDTELDNKVEDLAAAYNRLDKSLLAWLRSIKADHPMRLDKGKVDYEAILAELDPSGVGGGHAGDNLTSLTESVRGQIVESCRKLERLAVARDILWRALFIRRFGDIDI